MRFGGRLEAGKVDKKKEDVSYLLSWFAEAASTKSTEQVEEFRIMSMICVACPGLADDTTIRVGVDMYGRQLLSLNHIRFSIFFRCFVRELCVVIRLLQTGFL